MSLNASKIDSVIIQRGLENLKRKREARRITSGQRSEELEKVRLSTRRKFEIRWWGC